MLAQRQGLLQDDSEEVCVKGEVLQICRNVTSEVDGAAIVTDGQLIPERGALSVRNREHEHRHPICLDQVATFYMVWAHGSPLKTS